MPNKGKDELQVQIQYTLIERLTLSQRRQAKLLELLDECIFECDEQFCLSYVNLAWSRQLGYSSETLLGTSLCHFLVEEKSEMEFEACLSELLQGNSVELEFLDSQQRRRWFELRVTANDLGGYIGSLFDIQQHKNMQRRLKEQEEHARRLSLVASHTSNLVVITDRQGCIEWVNQSFETRTGYAAADVVGLFPGPLLQGPDTDPATVKTMSKAVRAGRSFQVELLNYDRTGNPYWVAIEASPVFVEKGELAHFIAIQTDITQRVLTEQALVESEYNYRSVVDHIPDIVLRIKPSGELLFVNQAWRRLIGGDKGSCVGSSITTFMDAAHRAEVENVLVEYRSGKRDNFRLDLRIQTRANLLIWVEMTMSPIFGGLRGELTAIAATLVDVDERVSTTRALQEAKQEAESLALAKSRFMANISHEIRTPLNAVLGAADILRESGLTTEQQRFADMITTSGDALLSILDDVLTYSRFEAGGITIEHNHFHLDACFEEAIDIVADEAVHKGLAIVLDIEPDVPLAVIGDKVRLRQILINLLANAVKFTPQGQILVRACSSRLEPQSPKSDFEYRLQLSVEDTGIGIEYSKREQLFQPFIQSDTTTTRQFGGSGLGLAICRQICDAAGGNIEVDSTLGVGTCFTVTLPLKLPCRPEKLPKPVLNEGIKPIIWVLCNRTALIHALENMLERYGLTCRVFSHICDFPKFPRKPCDVLIISDPADAEECEAYTRTLSVVRNTPCLIVLDLIGRGGLLHSGHANLLRLDGPFKLSHFLRGLEAIEDLHEGVLLRNPATDLQLKKKPLVHPSYQDKNILVVEDNKQNQVIVSQFLRQRGCRVLVAGDGAKAIKLLQTALVDLVLMDIQMPVMDGLTATQRIRSSTEDYAQVPIIAVTANAIHGDRERFLQAGMNDYLTKPLARRALYRLLDEYLEPTLTDSELAGDKLETQTLSSKTRRLQNVSTRFKRLLGN